jgi:signal transduction histidine kinase/PAS domain-containing protein
MSSDDTRPVSDQELASARHTLELLNGQVRSGHIEDDFMMRQFRKLSDLLERVQDERKAQQSAERFETLYEVTRILGTSLDLQTVLDQVMDAVIQLTGAERGFLMLRDDDGDLAVKAARNLDQQTLGSEEFEYSRSITGYVLDNGESVLTTNAVEDPRFKEQISVMTQSLRSIMATPLRARGRVIGVAYVENRVVAGLFSENDLTTMETLAGQASIAIDNALLFSETDEKLAQRVDELQLLRRIDRQLSEKLDPDDAMLFTLETACRIAEADAGHLGLVQGDPQRIFATHQYHRETASSEVEVYLDAIYPRAWKAIRDRETVSFDSGQYGLHTVLILPVLRENEAIGIVALRREDGNSFSSDQRDLLERVVSRAAVTIENARLYAAVQAADRAKSEFVGVVAHDLKAPMTGIQGYADLLLMSPETLDEKQLRFLQQIRDTVDRMAMLVADLSDIARVESGQFLMDEMSVDVPDAVAAVRDMVQMDMDKRNHTFEVNVPEDVAPVWTDYYRLLQVLTNLLTNACKYTPEGGQVRLDVIQRDERVHFSVSDTGIGLNEAQIAQLGTKFWRAEDEFTRSQPGTGLGFSITSRLVQQMGSNITVDSTPGEGSTFAFSVAIARDDSGDETTADPDTDPDDTTETPRARA